MRYVLIFLALVTFSFALASSVMLVHVSNEGELSLPAITGERPTTAVQGYATITIVQPEPVNVTLPEPVS